MDRKYLSDLLYECLPLNPSNPSISPNSPKHSKLSKHVKQVEHFESVRLLYELVGYKN